MPSLSLNDKLAYMSIAIITGFEPFADCGVNPSWLAVSALPASVGSFTLTRLLLPVSFEKAFGRLEEAIVACQPDLVICTGLATRRDSISIERIAINIDDARIPDNEGYHPIERRIDYSAPDAYFSCLPVRAICEKISEAGLPAAISDSAGTYVCNHVMFRLLHLIANRYPKILGGFIHVPATPEMSGNKGPGMPLADITRALQLAVEVCSDHSTHWQGSKRRIVEYNPGWPGEFTEIATQLHSGLGNLALRIDHIGSTSVPELAAKDVIDIQITVSELSDQLLAAMTAMGYTRSEIATSDHIPACMSDKPHEWQKWFFKAPPGQRPTNTHVRIAGRANQRYPLLFRDFLRAHPNYAKSYGELKKRLAANLANSRTYPDVKDPAVDLIYHAAENWAARICWQSE
ncbi:MAG: pyroglutamyl-peptidase I [Candidatus Riflebacteria bacterium HGW-Riflebacteria-2]|nr:MAG: pyroglutamyl-peptidase I [Candidatus Riflebacteria bacterium HGW-Riflebacteria-2]